VDDEASIRFFLQEALEREGYQVTPVECGEEALQRARPKRFDLALIDLRLPGMDGMQVLKPCARHHRHSHYRTHCLRLTGPRQSKRCGRARNDYLFKPCKDGRATRERSLWAVETPTRAAPAAVIIAVGT